jgi:ATP-binding cassette, subfamily B, bacterial MsbA
MPLADAVELRRLDPCAPAASAGRGGVTESPLPRLFGYSRPYRPQFAAALAAMRLYAGASAAVAYLIKPIINKVLPGQQGLSFTFWAAFILLAYLAKGLGSYFSTYLMTDIGQRVVRDLRNELFQHILNQSAAFFSRRTTGQLMSRITNDVNQVQQAVSETVGDLLREGLSVVGYAVMMFYFDWRLALSGSVSAARPGGARSSSNTCLT